MSTTVVRAARVLSLSDSVHSQLNLSTFYDSDSNSNSNSNIP